MRLPDILRMIFLAGIWGASFPLMRISVQELQPAFITAVRILGGSLFLAPLLIYRRGLYSATKANWKQIVCVGLFNSAIPFLCFSYASAAIAAGLASVFNSTTPLWGALIARIWIRQRLTIGQMSGLAIGFLGVLYLAWDTAGFKSGASESQAAWAVVACLFATACYGFSGIYTKQYLKGVPPLATATGSLLAAGAILLMPAATALPAKFPSPSVWIALSILALGCTSAAFVVFYRLIDNVGPTIAIAVAYLIPICANLWGWLLLGEPPTSAIVIGCGLILTGTSLTTGILKFCKTTVD